MILCSKTCIPCCDFCIYVIYDVIGVTPDGIGFINGGPVDCGLYKDKLHEKIAEANGKCNHFQCYKANKEANKWIVDDNI